MVATEVVWVRLGDEDDYHPHDSIEDAAQYLYDCGGVWVVERMPANPLGVTSVAGYQGNNYISIYWGTDPKDGSAEVTRPITDAEFEELNLSLDSCQ